MYSNYHEMQSSDVSKAFKRFKRRGALLVFLDSIRQPCLYFSLSLAYTYSEEHCDFLLQRCQGLDTTEIIDDEGGLSKTLSVENSFRRGTVRDMNSVWRGLDDLFLRLPKLLQDRTSWALDPDRAFPTTIRLTMRMVDPHLMHKRRPYVTRSKQAIINGKALIKEKDLQNQSLLLKNQVTPLLRQLLSTSEAKDINVTRMNIAVTNFQDVTVHSPQNVSRQGSLFSATKKRRVSPNETVVGDESLKKARKHTRDGRQEEKDVSARIGDYLDSHDNSSFGASAHNRGAWRSLNTRDLKAVRRKLPVEGAKMKTTRIDHFFNKK